MDMKAKKLFCLRFTFLISMFFVTLGIFAQVKVEGTVTDEMGEALSGVSVRLKGGKSLGITNVDGKYSVKVPSKQSVLIFSYIGFKKQEETVGKRTVINVKLGDNASDLDGAVVVAYGTARKGDVTGALTTIRPSDKDAATNLSVDAMLMGKVPGLVVSSSDGQVGAANSVVIRGANSLRGDNQPLYVIDNVPQASTGEFSESGIGGDYQVNANPLASLNPNDIADITILKDASATAIYGSRGANGVILITTKKGKSSKVRANVSATFTLSQVTHLMDMLDLKEYAAYQNSRVSDGSYHYYQQEDGSIRYVSTDNLNSYRESPIERHTNSETGETEGNYDVLTYRNWQKLIYHTAFSQNYNVNISGGIGKKATFYVSGSFKHMEGTTKQTSLTQGDLRANLNFDLSSKVKLAVQLNGSIRRNNMMAGGNATGSQSGAVSRTALNSVPYERPDDDPDNKNEVSTTVFSWLNDYVDKNDNKTFRGSFDLTWKILENLTYDLRAGGAVVANDRHRWYGMSLYQGMNNDGLLSISDLDKKNYSVENVLNYKLQFKEVARLDLTGGVTFEKYKYLNKNTLAAFFSDDLKYNHDNDIVDGKCKATPGTPTQKDYQLASFLGRANLSLLDRYLLTFSFRADGSSKFAKGNRWGYFPSVAVAWRMEQEPWLKDVDFLNQLKPRLSYGVTGNQSIAPYSTFSQYTLATDNKYHYADGNGNSYSGGSLVISNLANKDLTWEQTSSWNAGIDFSFLRTRLNGTIDVYYKKTTDLLITRDLQGSAGISQTIYNQGTLSNKGVEFSLNVVPIETKDWHWEVSGNIGINRSRINDLGNEGFDCGYLSTVEGGSYTNGFYGNEFGNHFGVGNIFLEGKAPGLFFGYKTDGIVQTEDVTENGIYTYTDAEGNAHYYTSNASSKAGDIKFVDVNGDGKIDKSDRTIIGDPNPGFTYGFSTSLTWKSFTLSMQFTGVHDRDIFNTNNRYINLPGKANQTITKEAYYNMWTVDNPSNLYPSSTFEVANLNGMVLDRYIEDGSYLRCSDITLNWVCPSLWAKLIHCNSISAYFTVKNAFIITDYKGYDPEVNSFAFDGLRQGVDMSSYPTPRQFILGINLGF